MEGITLIKQYLETGTPDSFVASWPLPISWKMALAMANRYLCGGDKSRNELRDDNDAKDSFI